MKSKRLITLAIACGLLSVTGCDEDPSVSEGLLSPEELQELEERERVTFRVIEDNGTELNGTELNGFRLNGFRLNGFRLNGNLLNNFRRRANDSRIVANDPTNNNEEVEASELEAAEMEFDTQDDQVTNTDERVKVDNVTQSLAQPDVYFNMVKFLKMPENTWKSLCEDGAGNPVEAIALSSTWDPDTGADLEDGQGLTWACRGAALAKCVEWGYRRWASHNGQNLRKYHKACTRMVRGDYCGNGTPHTSNGTPIDIADNLGLNTHDTTAGVDGWEIEAKWGPNGAVCLNNPRKVQWTRTNIGCSIPMCNNDQSDFEGALLMTVTQQTN